MLPNLSTLDIAVKRKQAATTLDDQPATKPGNREWLSWRDDAIDVFRRPRPKTEINGICGSPVARDIGVVVSVEAAKLLRSCMCPQVDGAGGGDCNPALTAPGCFLKNQTIEGDVVGGYNVVALIKTRDPGWVAFFDQMVRFGKNLDNLLAAIGVMRDGQSIAIRCNKQPDEYRVLQDEMLLTCWLASKRVAPRVFAAWILEVEGMGRRPNLYHAFYITERGQSYDDLRLSFTRSLTSYREQSMGDVLRLKACYDRAADVGLVHGDTNPGNMVLFGAVDTWAVEGGLDLQYDSYLIDFDTGPTVVSDMDRDAIFFVNAAAWLNATISHEARKDVPLAVRKEHVEWAQPLLTEFDLTLLMGDNARNDLRGAVICVAHYAQGIASVPLKEQNLFFDYNGGSIVAVYWNLMRYLWHLSSGAIRHRQLEPYARWHQQWPTVVAAGPAAVDAALAAYLRGSSIGVPWKLQAYTLKECTRRARGDGNSAVADACVRALDAERERYAGEFVTILAQSGGGKFDAKTIEATQIAASRGGLQMRPQQLMFVWSQVEAAVSKTEFHNWVWLRVLANYDMASREEKRDLSQDIVASRMFSTFEVGDLSRTYWSYPDLARLADAEMALEERARAVPTPGKR